MRHIPFIALFCLLLAGAVSAAEHTVHLAQSMSSIQPFTVTSPELEKHSAYELRRMETGSVHLAGPRARAILVAQAPRTMAQTANPEDTMDLAQHPVHVAKVHQVLVATLRNADGEVVMTAEHRPSCPLPPKQKANETTVVAQTE